VNPSFKFRLLLLLSTLASGVSLLYMHQIQGPWIHYLDRARGEVIDPMGDLYPPWIGARELLLHRRNPYLPEVTHEIQMAFYGHPIRQIYSQVGPLVINEQRFVYPVYTVFVMAPIIWMGFADVRTYAPFALGLMTSLSVLIYLDLLRWRPPWEVVTALVLFTLSSPQVVQGLRLEQLALLVSFLLSLGAWCVTRQHYKTAGVLLALSTIKPQIALLPLCWFVIWAVGDWTKRWRLAASFIFTVTGLLVASEVLLPGWMRYFLINIAAYRKYAPIWGLLPLALGNTVGTIVGSCLVLALLHYAWRNRKEPAHSRQFATVFAAFLMGTLLVFPLFIPFNQVLLILPALLLIQDWQALPRFSRLVFTATISWPWISSSLLLMIRPRVDSPHRLPLLPTFLGLFLPILLPLLLMTRRSKTAEPLLSAPDLSAASL